ncbi:hypothetical protein ABHI18_004507 [Aspergillus niger]
MKPTSAFTTIALAFTVSVNAAATGYCDPGLNYCSSVLSDVEMHSEVMAMILPRKPRDSGRPFYSIAMMTDHLQLLRSVLAAARTMGLDKVTLAPM